MAKFVSKYGKPITASRSAMRPTAITGQAGSEKQAENQISAAPMPFQNPRGPVAPVQSHQQFKSDQQQGTTGGIRARANTATAPRSAPAAHSTRMKQVGYAGDYKAQYNPSTHPIARARIMRGQVPGAKPLVKPMDSSDFAEGAALYRKEHGRL